MKKKLLLSAKVTCIIFTFIYAIIAACCFSLYNKIYWLFLFLMVLSLCVGLYYPTIEEHLLENGNEYTKKDKIILIVLTCLSVVACPACIFSLLALLSTGVDKTKVVVNEDYQAKEKVTKPWYKSTPFIVSCVALLGILIFAVIGNVTETNGFKLKITEDTLTKKETDLYNKDQPLNGASFTINDETVSYSFTEYKPKGATPTNPYPVLFVLPGFTRTKASMSQYAIEVARRGAIVYVLDPGCQGASTYTGYETDENGEKVQNAYNEARSGLGYLIQYIYNNVEEYDYIDRDRIGVIGHSAGGGDACKLASDFAGNSYDESIIKALYISGYIKTSAANLFYKLHCNTALSYAKYDEGAFRYQDENQAYEVIALRFINEVNSKNNGANGHYDDYIEDYEYGDLTAGTYRILHHELTNHCFEMYDKPSIANTINFFKQSLGLKTKLADGNQVWFIQELSNGLMLAFAFMLTISLCGLVVLYVPFMKSLSEAGKERMENENELRLAYSNDVYTREVSVIDHKTKTFGKKLCFWLPMVLTAIIACLDYIPLARLSMDLFPEAAGNIYTYKFPARMMNAVFLWAVFNGTIGLVLFFGITALENLYYHIESRITKRESRVDWSKFKGLKVKPLDLLKSLGLAIILFLLFYGILQIVYLLTHQDYRFMLVSASPLQWRFVVTWLIYLAGFYIFYVSNSIRVNLSIAREGFKEWQVMIISGLANSLGLVFIIVINYWAYFRTGTVFYGYYSATDLNEMWLYINMVFGLIPMMFILPIFNRIIYKRVGNVYAGALLWCMIFIMMSLSASISHIPM